MDGNHRINYGEGLTATERLLKRLGEGSFLRFWSHANPYVNPTQELCDLLVVCGNYVVLFSDKSVQFRTDIRSDIGWRRWYREAVEKSASQLMGASRRLITLKSPVYKDQPCTIPLGVPIPSPDHVQLFHVAVVSSSNEAHETQSLFPFLRIDSHIKGNQHCLPGSDPFRVGDVNPTKDFIHVIDVAGLTAILNELDTITDFARYLLARRDFIRDKDSNTSDSEQCMLASYLLAYDDDGTQMALDHTDPGTTHLSTETWQTKDIEAAFALRRVANRESYIWDELIESQAQMIEQQSFEFSTYNSVEQAEEVVRQMALESRLNRRILSKTWMEVCLYASPEFPARLRTVPPNNSKGTTYVFLTVSNIMGEAQATYRAKRRDLLQKMMLASLVDYPDIGTIIGIAAQYGTSPDSYDLAYLAVDKIADESLFEDALVAWKIKKQTFEVLGSSVVDERDIPYS